MYDLLVFYPGDAPHRPSRRVEATTAAAVLDVIPTLLAEHEGCERVVVMMGVTRLFSVDCHGNRLP